MKIVPTTTWYLEMRQKPLADVDLPDGYQLGHHRPNLSEYLSIYKEVGGNYNWFDRILMAEDKLNEIITSEFTEILVLKFNAEIAGFIEYDTSNINETEIVYFGLCTKYTGKRVGFPFLVKAIDHAWKRPINRLWLHTCDLDHPAALPLYRKAGFEVYKTETVMQRVK